MHNNLGDLTFRQKKAFVRLLVKEVIVDTHAEEIIIRHTLPLDKTHSSDHSGSSGDSDRERRRDDHNDTGVESSDNIENKWKGNMKRLRLFLVLVAVLGLGGWLLSLREHDEPSLCYQAIRPEQHAFNLERVHLYTNIGIPLEKACDFGITVNGLWNGWGMNSPVASMHPEMLFWRFKDDQEYVHRFHAAGFRHGSTLSNVYAHPSQLKTYPELKPGIDRTVTGKMFELDGGWYLGQQPFMCQNSPQWQGALLGRAKQMIDAGSDIIVFDEPFGETIFASLPLPEFPGFSDWDLQLLTEALGQNFTPEALLDQFGLNESPTVEHLRQQFVQADLSQLMDAETLLADVSPTERLWRYFRQVQLRENFTVKQRLVEDIQAYALNTRGTHISIGANLAELESYSVLTQQLPVLYLAELFDFLAFEMAYRPPIEERLEREGKEAFVLDARGKWMSWYALGEALVGPHRTLAYPSQEMVDAWMGTEQNINYLCHLFVEAYAAQGGFIIPFADFGEHEENILQQHTQFVKHHAEFYEDVESVASIGVLYAHSDDSPPHHWSYLGVTQALYESGLPFSVIYTSSTQAGYPAPSCEQLSRYEVLLLPIMGSLAPHTGDVISRYAEQGGTVVLFDTIHPFDVSREPGFQAYGEGGFLLIAPQQSMSIGETYFRTYDNAVRTQLADDVRAYLSKSHPLILPNNHREWATLVYTQPEEQRIIMHVLNYDYVPDTDEFRPKHNLKIRLDMSAFDVLLQNAARQCVASSPKRAESILLDCRQRGEYLELTIPELFHYELIIIETEGNTS